MNGKHFWRIEGFDGTELVFETSVPLHHLSQKQVEEVLRRLTCRHLSENEIVEASLNRRAKRTMLLDIRRDAQTPLVMSCGENPHYVARLVDE